ncbi:MAG: AAA family ATPase [Deltaproteobacteria bacterium]|nr:AAA family ATPase [Deltaproteobacteria bacterium]
MIIRGARQVGKTWSVSTFCKEHFATPIHLDFERSLGARRIFEDDLSPKELLQRIEAFSGKRVIPGESAIFMDEIQTCAGALKSLKYFCEKMPELHVMAAGSLLELALEGASFPVGKVEFLRMKPMSFSEFLLAQGLDVVESKRPELTVDPVPPVDKVVHQKLMEQLGKYLLVGGMPEAVRRYLETGSLASAGEVLESLAVSIPESFGKYKAGADALFLSAILGVLAKSVGRRVKYSAVAPGTRVEKVKRHLAILEQGMLFQRVGESAAHGLPLGAAISPAGFKPLILDTGLMQRMCGVNAGEVLMGTDLLDVHRGALCEQFVGQEIFFAGGSELGKMYCWSRGVKSSNAEIDYLLVRERKIHPVEVKSGPAGKLRSLHVFLDEHPESGDAYVLGTSPETGQVGRIRFLPLYARM